MVLRTEHVAATRCRLLLSALLVGGVLVTRDVRGQGCVVARQSAPTVGAEGGGSLLPGQWQLALGARWFRSSRHFIGTSEQEGRALTHSQTINDVTTFELEGARALTTRAWISVALPYFIGERSEPIYASDGATVVARNRTSARGVGDMSFTLRSFILDPEAAPRGNVALGLGLKLPTGQPGATGVFAATDAPQSARTVDPSIQPGDGGLGFILSAQGFVQAAPWAFYGSGSYLVNPRETNGVLTSQPRPSEAYLSVPDAYLARLGALLSLGRGVTASLGPRFEGTPVRDVIGGSGGFRRPGYTLSVEPGVGYASGSWSVTSSVPIALVRNRQQSVPERADGVRGDAAFADFSILVGLSYRFAAPMDHGAPSSLPAPANAHHPPGDAALFLGELGVPLRPVPEPPRDAPEALGHRFTVVNVWATWCPACRDEIPLLNELAATYRGRGISFVGVSVDEGLSEIERFRRDVPMAYPTLWAGPDATTALASKTVPTTLVLDSRGRVVATLHGALARGTLEARLAALEAAPP